MASEVLFTPNAIRDGEALVADLEYNIQTALADVPFSGATLWM